MPNPTLTSLVNSSNFNTEAANVQFTTAFVCSGATYFRYAEPVFNGASGASSVDPGGLFGWLLYARSPALSTNPRGSTADTYIEYFDVDMFIRDINKLSGITYCLVSTPTQGGTFGFFTNNSSVITGKTYGIDLLLALNYLAYGNYLVLAGNTAGLDDWESEQLSKIDALIGITTDSSLCSWLKTKPYTFGIFPSIADSTGQVGAGYTLPNYTSFAGASFAAAGSSFSSRIVTVNGVKAVYDTKTESLVPGSSLQVYYIPAVADVAGFFSRARNSNNLYFSIAGTNNAVPLNGTIVNPIQYSDSQTKTILQNNRVNYFLNYSNNFLGQDLVGATSSSSTPTAIDRVGPNALKIQIEKDVTDIALKYLFTVNNTTTRSLVISDVQSYMSKLNSFLDTTATEITCDETNGNVDNTNALYITVEFKPIVSTSTFTVNVSLIS
jgi:hypothetical protein